MAVIPAQAGIHLLPNEEHEIKMKDPLRCCLRGKDDKW
jgi:hypothetical protein